MKVEVSVDLSACAVPEDQVGSRVLTWRFAETHLTVPPRDALPPNQHPSFFTQRYSDTEGHLCLAAIKFVWDRLCRPF